MRQNSTASSQPNHTDPTRLVLLSAVPLLTPCLSSSKFFALSLKGNFTGAEFINPFRSLLDQLANFSERYIFLFLLKARISIYFL